MTKYYIHKPIYSLLLVLTFLTSCNGQVKTQPQTDNQSETKITPFGQPKLITKQSSKENDNVHCGLQDKFGNLWFGTTGDGVYRYDGKTFTQFTVKDGLSSNTVWSILEDKKGNIWIGTYAGVCCYDGKNISKISLTNENTNYLITTADKAPSIKNDVWCMKQDKSGTIWFGTTDGVYCYNGKTFSRFLDNVNIINKQNLQLKWIQCILEDSSGTIWMGSGLIASEGVIRYDGKSLISSKPNGDGWIRYMLRDKKENIWFGGRNNGNFSYDGNTFTNFTEKIDIGNSILCDKQGNIWFTGAEANNNFENKNGIWTYDRKGFKNFSTKDGMGNYFVHCMIEDRDGNIWIGTRKTGLYKYDGKTFTNFSE